MSEQPKVMPTAIETMDKLVDGVRRFREVAYPAQRELFQKLAHEQTPQVMFITCADSRIIPELITQSEPGDLFVTRNVGNVVPPYGQMMGGVSTAIEFAVLALNVKHIIVCGHSDCGAMKAVLKPASLEKLPTVKAWLRHAEVAKTVVEENCGCGHHDPLQLLTQENVLAQLDHLRTHPSVASRLARGDLFIHGWIYNIETSEITAYDAEKGDFRPVTDEGAWPHATPKARY